MGDRKLFLNLKIRENFLFLEETITFIFQNMETLQKITFLEQVSRYKTLMVATISHELRTPLNGIMGILECAMEERLGKDFIQQFLRPCLDCSNLLLHLINDILDYTQMNFKKLRMHFKAVSLRK